MERAPDRPHSKYPHVYPIVRIDTPIDESHPTNTITVVKVLTSQGAAEAEVSRLNEINAGKRSTFSFRMACQIHTLNLRMPELATNELS